MKIVKKCEKIMREKKKDWEKQGGGIGDRRRSTATKKNSTPPTPSIPVVLTKKTSFQAIIQSLGNKSKKWEDTHPIW